MDKYRLLRNIQNAPPAHEIFLHFAIIFILQTAKNCYNVTSRFAARATYVKIKGPNMKWDPRFVSKLLAFTDLDSKKQSYRPI